MGDEDKNRRKNEQAKSWYAANKELCKARTNENRRKRKLNPEYRERERAKRRARTAENKIIAKRMTLDAKKDGCIHCGEDHPAALDFHHKDPSTKKHKISDWYRFTSLTRLKEEIEKCDVICSNCHRKLHAEERGYYGYL